MVLESQQEKSDRRPLTLFALLNFGLVESVEKKLIHPKDAVGFFYHADNCLFVKRHFLHKIAGQIMSYGVQLGDWFEILPKKIAQREYRNELDVIRNLCLKILGQQRLVA
jgi:hypothetical protein